MWVAAAILIPLKKILVKRFKNQKTNAFQEKITQESCRGTGSKGQSSEAKPDSRLKNGSYWVELTSKRVQIQIHPNNVLSTYVLRTQMNPIRTQFRIGYVRFIWPH